MKYPATTHLLATLIRALCSRRSLRKPFQRLRSVLNHNNKKCTYRLLLRCCNMSVIVVVFFFHFSVVAATFFYVCIKYLGVYVCGNNCLRYKMPQLLRVFLRWIMCVNVCKKNVGKNVFQIVNVCMYRNASYISYLAQKI